MMAEPFVFILPQNLAPVADCQCACVGFFTPTEEKNAVPSFG